MSLVADLLYLVVFVFVILLLIRLVLDWVQFFAREWRPRGLAQKLHDDYVRSGQEESDRLISEAKSQGARIVREAEETSARTLGQLEQERSLLERKIDELRVFERDYRTRLKSYLENLLGDLDNRGSALPPRSGQNAQPVGEGRTL